MSWLRFAATLSFCLLSASVIAEEDGASFLVERWVKDELSSSELIEMMEGMQDAKHESMVRSLGEVLRKQPDMEDAVATIVCAIKPWTLGTEEENADFQGELWTAMRKHTIWSSPFKRMDCAAANRRGFYFDSVIAPVKEFRERLCDDSGDISSREVHAVLGSVRNAIDTTRKGTGGDGPQSFYPLRNATRGAMLLAHLGVMAAQDQRDEDARNYFAQAVEALELEFDANQLVRTRNGWRFHTDLHALAGVYSLFAGDHSGGVKLLDRVRKWKPVVEDTPILDGLGPELGGRAGDVYSGIESTYHDPIFVERLLPGAAEDAKKECERWRRRSYFPENFGEKGLQCAINIGREKSLIDKIRTFDACFSTLVATDWRVQFISYEAAEEPDKAILDPFRQKLKDLDLHTFAEHLTFLYTQSTGMVQITTYNKLSTEEIEAARATIIENFGDVLFARKRQY